MRPRAALRKESTLNIADILRLFPAVIAPALVDRLRRRWPALDGLLVWPVVVAVAVALSVLGALTAGPVTLAGAVAAAREGHAPRPRAGRRKTPAAASPMAAGSHRIPTRSWARP